MASDDSALNPWLSIPASDYEAHMSSPRVQQSQYLSDAFRRALERHRPASVAVLGCATGNGFEHLPRTSVRRVVAVDIQPDFLEILRVRHGAAVSGLEIQCADFAHCEIEPASIDLVWGALVFEYVDPGILLEKISGWLAPGGVLSIVLQLRVAGKSAVTETPFASLKLLEPVLKLVDPEDFDRLADRCRLVRRSSRTVTLATGKSFYEADYRNPA